MWSLPVIVDSRYKPWSGIFIVHRKMPEKESDHLTPATRLLEKRREMSEVEQALATQKEVRSSGI